MKVISPYYMCDEVRKKLPHTPPYSYFWNSLNGITHYNHSSVQFVFPCSDMNQYDYNCQVIICVHVCAVLPPSGENWRFIFSVLGEGQV